MTKQPMITEDQLSHSVDVIKNGGTLSMMQDIHTDDLEAIYSIAHTFYVQRRYKKSEQLFSYLCLYQHMDKRFWKGLAASRQMQKNYRKAAEAYAYMAIIDMDDPEPSFHAAFCFMELKETKSASKALDAAMHQAKGKKRYQPLLEQARQMLNKLKTGDDHGG